MFSTWYGRRQFNKALPSLHLSPGLTGERIERFNDDLYIIYVFCFTRIRHNIEFQLETYLVFCIEQ